MTDWKRFWAWFTAWVIAIGMVACVLGVLIGMVACVLGVLK